MKKGVTLDTNSLNWENLKELGDGVWCKILNIDEDTGATFAIMKIKSGVVTPRHSHPSTEDMFILKGAFRVGDYILRAGTYQCNLPGLEHGPYEAIEDSEIIISKDGPLISKTTFK